MSVKRIHFLTVFSRLKANFVKKKKLSKLGQSLRRPSCRGQVKDVDVSRSTFYFIQRLGHF